MPSRRFWSTLAHGARCHRFAQFLRLAAGRHGAAFRRRDPESALGWRGGPVHRRAGLCDALSRIVRGTPASPAGDDARRTGRRELAALRAFRLGPDRRFDAAAARFLRRSHPARPCAGNRRTSARIAVGGLARADAGRQADRRRPESLGPLGAARHDAVRPWPSLFAGAAARPDARNAVFAHLLERSALYAAPAARGVAASRSRDRTGQRPAVAAGRGRAGRGGDQAALSAGRRPALATGLAGTRAGSCGGPDAAAFRLGTGGSRHGSRLGRRPRAAADAGFIARRRASRSVPWPSDRRSGRARV